MAETTAQVRKLVEKIDRLSKKDRARIVWLIDRLLEDPKASR